MKTYVTITGTVFGLITLAHVWRLTEEGSGVLSPWWILITLAAAALSIWAFRLVRLSKTS